MTKRVYLDYAATAPLLPEVREAMLDCYASGMGNASSLYREGRLARQTLEESRETLAQIAGCAPQELSFCSGGTEAAGTLIEGISRGTLEKLGANKTRKHILCASFEHHAVYKSVRSLKRYGFEVEWLHPNKEGFIDPAVLNSKLRSDTFMVLVMLAQNELGTVQDIVQLSRLAKEVGALFVSDWVQGFCKLPLSLTDAACDAVFFSAHKLGGPPGVGAFYLNPRVPFLPRQLGGGQELKRRSGTQNVPGALGFAIAATTTMTRLRNGEGARLATLRDDLLTSLRCGSGCVRPTVPIASGDISGHLPGYLHLLVQGIDSQTMVLKLDELGFAVSDGSACSAGSLEPSHVLSAIGISKSDAYGALRISMGNTTTEEDCMRFSESLLSLI